MKISEPAFPSIQMMSGPNGDRAVSMGGMSLRDYLAAAVIPSAVQILWEAGSAGGTTTRAAKIAYEVADAMLAEREKQ